MAAIADTSLRQAAIQVSNRHRDRPAARGGPNPDAATARMVGKRSDSPAPLANLDYVDQEDEIRTAIRGSGVEFGSLTPKAEFPPGTLRFSAIAPGGPDGNPALPRDFLNGAINGPELKLLRCHPPHLPTLVSFRAMRDLTSV